MAPAWCMHCNSSIGNRMHTGKSLSVLDRLWRLQDCWKDQVSLGGFLPLRNKVRIAAPGVQGASPMLKPQLVPIKKTNENVDNSCGRHSSGTTHAGGTTGTARRISVRLISGTRNPGKLHASTARTIELRCSPFWMQVQNIFSLLQACRGIMQTSLLAQDLKIA